MRQLSLSTSKLAKYFTDAHSLKPTAGYQQHIVSVKQSLHLPSEDGVKLLAPSRYFDDTLPLLPEFMRSLEASS
jgi:hypothetical protein